MCGESTVAVSHGANLKHTATLSPGGRAWEPVRRPEREGETRLCTNLTDTVIPTGPGGVDNTVYTVYTKLSPGTLKHTVIPTIQGQRGA